MDIKTLATDIIVALGIVPKENVLINVISPDWSGKPEIRIASEPTTPEDETQFGAITETTVMGIHVLAETRQQAKDLKKQAADAVYDRFEELEQQRGSGILCIVPIEHNTHQYLNTEAYHSYTNFRVLHQP